MTSLHAWLRAWEAAMAESGYPRARITPEFYGPEEGWTYGWVEDVDLFAARANGEPVTYDEAMHDAWNTAHLAFLLVDPLRPEWMEPSLMLQTMMQAIKDADE